MTSLAGTYPATNCGHGSHLERQPLAHKRAQTRRGWLEGTVAARGPALGGPREPGNKVSAPVMDRAFDTDSDATHRKNANKVAKWYRFGTYVVHNPLIPLELCAV